MVSNDWDLVFGSLVWATWLCGNQFIFAPGECAPESLLQQSFCIGGEALHAFSSRTSTRLHIRSGVVVCCWLKPHQVWIKVNMDGARNPSTWFTYFGGVGGDENTQWCFGFSKKIGICSAFEVELWAIYEDFVTACKDWEMCIKWVNHECNMVADKLAKMAKDLLMEYHQFLDPLLLVVDKTGRFPTQFQERDNLLGCTEMILKHKPWKGQEINPDDKPMFEQLSAEKPAPWFKPKAQSMQHQQMTEPSPPQKQQAKVEVADSRRLKGKRARLYIIRRCIFMLLCWNDRGDKSHR
ncbi:hypothetical protein GQ457_11G025220 [Hibiscus cannabinus]